MTSPITPPPFLARPFAQAMNAQGHSLLRLATGLRINRGADDPSGLIAAENLRAALATLEAETRALDRADAVASTADGYLGEISSQLRDADAIAVAAANSAGLSDAEREAYQIELDSIAHSVERITQTASFNGERLFDGSSAIATAGHSVALDELSLSGIGRVEVDGVTYSLADVVSGADADLASSPEIASRVIDAARDQIATMRGRVGAFQAHHVEPARAQNAAATRNLSSALSIIADTDFAAQTSELVRSGLLSASSASALLLGQQSTSHALSLLAA
ncbi:MAG: flagellin [Phycisphaerales bacterium JB059]